MGGVDDARSNIRFYVEADRRRCDEKLVTVLLVVSRGGSRLLSVTARPQMMGPGS